MSIPTFARKATGLVREFSIVDMLAFNVFAFCLGMVTAVGPFTIPILYPGADFGVALAIATVVTLISGYVYMQLAVAMPRSGGDYVYLSHTISPALGFMVSGGFVFGIFYWIAQSSIFCNWGIADFVCTLGLATNNRALVEMVPVVNSPVWMQIIGTLCIVFCTVFIILGTRFLRKFFTVMFVVCMAGSLILLSLILLASSSQFVQNYNAQMQPYTQLADTYEAIISSAKNAGYESRGISLLACFMALPYAQWTYLGFQYSVYIGGEVKTPSKTQPIAILGSVILGFVIIYVTATGFVNLVGRDFVNSMAFLGGFEGVPMRNLINSYVPMMTDNLFINAFVGINFFLWNLLVELVGYVAATRIIFGWAFNRVTPISMANVSSRFHSPWVATLFMGVGGWIFFELAAFTPFASRILNFIVIFVAVFFLGGFAAIALPFTKKELFAASPKLVNQRVAGVPVILIMGVLNIFFFGFMLYSCFINPSYFGLTIWVFAYDAVCFLIPLVGYLVAKEYRKRHGLDIDLMWKEIPPE